MHTTIMTLYRIYVNNNAPINDLPHSPHAGNTRGFYLKLLPKLRGIYPSLTALVEYLEDTYEVSFLSEESISD